MGGPPAPARLAQRRPARRPTPRPRAFATASTLIAMARDIRLHDSLSGSMRVLEPRDPGRVGIYACGPTVYDRVHVGNARPFVLFALLKRFLEHEGYEVTLVENVTDINDKIYDAARERGVASSELANEMTAAYVADTDALGLGRPDREPTATETVERIVDLIQALLHSGHAYAAGGDVYFRVASFPDYGKLSNRPLDQMDQGEDDAAAPGVKEDARDFALWKAHKEGEDTSWEAPWGRGRPGWHIECSAMAEEILGLDFDIHGGGSDLVFPHHENEIAQTEAARGRPLARIWMHNGMVQIEDDKMSKSVGNIRALHAAIEAAGRDALVMFLVSGHWRQPLAFSEEALEEADRAVERVREFSRRLVRAGGDRDHSSDDRPHSADGAGPSGGQRGAPDGHDRGAEADGDVAELAALHGRFFDELADDFNTPGARAAMFEWIAEGNRRLDAGRHVRVEPLREMLWMLGLERLLAGAEAGDEVDPEAERLLREREEARAERDFATADARRDELAARGFEVRDTPAGPELVRRR